MIEIEPIIKQIKKNVRRKNFNPNLPARVWSEKDRVLGEVGKSFVVVLRTGGCSWSKKSGCSMCGYFNDSLNRDVKANEVLTQMRHALSLYSNEDCIKIFTSGSFLDEEEVPFDAQLKVMEMLSQRKDLKVISVESRPEFISKEKLRKLREAVGDKILEVSIGLESANEKILKYCINKGLKFEDYKRAARILRKEKVRTKTYILLKPPFLKEIEAIKDCVETAKKIKELTDVISLNPVAVHRNTLVEYLWKRKEYRPPWLWSVIETIREIKKLGNVEIKCDVTGKGSRRGAHNCKKCSNKILDIIKEFSLKQDLGVFEGAQCDCKYLWEDLLDLEMYSYGELVACYERDSER
ncbi:MAG: TIGR01210 family radical SAM protein [Thermoplasmata archaeon]|nr:MAG: TIGR01210 family radical SAM protein [Thermoplasmata archaeon]